jgi:16S rRNA (cytidine1402-2'-O)-methyltransferase
LCRELTKVHEEVRRGSLAELAASTGDGVLGEVTLVVAGAPDRAPELSDLVDQVESLAATGMRLREAVKRVARAAGVGGSDLYAAVQASRQ